MESGFVLNVLQVCFIVFILLSKDLSKSSQCNIEFNSLVMQTFNVNCYYARCTIVPTYNVDIDLETDHATL